jgi:predicted nucleotidyltransferase
MKPEDYGFSEEEYNILIQEINRFVGVTEIILYGSRALGKFGRGSDVDLALKGIDKETALRIKLVLNEAAPLAYTFDVVSFDDLRESDFKEVIRTEGKRIFS